MIESVKWYKSGLIKEQRVVWRLSRERKIKEEKYGVIPTKL